MKGAAYIGCPALVLGRVVAVSAWRNLPSSFKRLPKRPMASALLEQLKTAATEVKRSQLEDAVGASCAALAGGEDPEGEAKGLYCLNQEQKEEVGGGDGV